MNPHPENLTVSPREIAAPAIERPIVVYAGYNVMNQQDHWDEATRQLILRRIHDVPPIRFFSPAEAQTLTALVERVLPQGDRPPDRRIPIVPWIDDRCFRRIIDGWRFDNMPAEDEAWRLGLRGVDQAAQAHFRRPFVDLTDDQQDVVVRLIADGSPPGAAWQYLPAQRFWIYVVLRQVCSIYYAHPISWDEIGFGGPAYPRGYSALNHGYPEPWEVREVRLDETSR
ncbi:MAG TPA: gluconate 2-dehydrogenase subunit 3 family protein [Chloroflexota bacterium]|nr:gluconate 2-dehydrogenase subunit 3 family protein [Chloroflexota bacterium]